MNIFEKMEELLKEALTECRCNFCGNSKDMNICSDCDPGNDAWDNPSDYEVAEDKVKELVKKLVEIYKQTS